MNNLLTAIMGNATLAEQELPEDSPVPEYIEQIDAASRQAASLCQQMLAYSGKGKFVVRPLNLSTMVEDMLGLLRASISKHAELHCRLDRHIRAIDADEAQMQQVLMNLVINASEAIGEEHGLITITTKQKHVGRRELEQAYLDEDLPEGDYVVFEVSDTGCGMDAETREKIFDPFFTTKFTGRGLGMSAIMGIVRGHKGAISVFSEPGGGTTFRMLFPCSQGEVSDVAMERTIPDWRGMGTVLVVDDEQAIRRVAARMLERMGYQVIEAADGEEGVAVYRQYKNQIALVLLDMSMPNMDGRECFQELLRINPDVKVILSSGYNEQEATQSFAGTELAGFVQKPHTLKALRGKVREVLG
ncbi:MAG: response regulator [Mariprofundaceae bacterium]|nr:response regulator [Mariprofundaceae bacterium]